MKILFVCRANVGRSQMAEVIYRKKTSFETASAGTRVHIENQKISDRPLAKPVIKFMKKEGINVSENCSNQIVESDLDNFDKVVVMAEPETIPDFLKNSSKFIYWDIEDPKGMDDEGYKIIILEIKTRIKELIRNN